MAVTKHSKKRLSALMADEGGWYPPDNEAASLAANEPVSASLHYRRTASLPNVVKLPLAEK